MKIQAKIICKKCWGTGIVSEEILERTFPFYKEAKEAEDALIRSGSSIVGELSCPIKDIPNAEILWRLYKARRCSECEGSGESVTWVSLADIKREWGNI